MTARSAGEALSGLMLNPQVAWSLGRLGALAEFTWDEREPITRDRLSIATARGALHIADGHPHARLFAGESLGHAPNGWMQWISLCAPREESALGGHATITEIGPDRAALRAESREAVLFDLGLGGSHFRLSVRTESADLIAELRAVVGQPLLSCDGLMQSLVSRSPHRVFESRLARIEVMQPIAAVNGKSPEGPHTHLLPKLLRGDGTESANAPCGWVAQIVAHPPHPLRDVQGKSKPFDVEAYRAFRQWLHAFGDAGHLRVKEEVAQAVRSGASPGPLDRAEGRRDSVRIALRQLRAIEGDSPALARWREAYEDR